MGVARALAREGIRRRRAALVVIAILIAGGLGAAVTSLEVADRTQHAYPDYLNRAAVSELVVNTSLATEKTEPLIRSVAGVVEVRSDSLFAAWAGEKSSDFLQVRASHDGRYTDQDRPAVESGRMIRSGKEAFVSREAARALGVAVGDTLPMSFFQEGFAGPDGPAAPRPLGTVPVRVVGVGVFPGEVLADELFPREKILVTSEVARPFDCTRHQPDADDPRSFEELTPVLAPPGCAFLYQYFSLRVRGGDAGAKRVADALATRFREENVRLPPAVRANNIGFEVIASFRSDDAARAQRSLSPVVTALRAFGVVAGLATIAVALLLVGRLLRRRGDDVAVWRALGISPADRALGLALPPAGAIVAGLVVSIGLAWLASPMGPVASARAVVPDSSRALSIAAVLAVACGNRPAGNRRGRGRSSRGPVVGGRRSAPVRDPPLLPRRRAVRRL